MLKSFEELHANGEMTPVPGGFSNYLCHCESGRVWSKLRNKWLLEDAKGTGDNNKYLMTALKDDNGNVHQMYLHEIIMSSAMGITKQEWRAMNLEVDHIDNNDTKNCCIDNLRLVTSVMNKKNSKYRFWNKVRLSKEVAQQIRDEFKSWRGSKIEWYKMKGKEFGVTARSIQNIILGYTYQEVNE